MWQTLRGFPQGRNNPKLMARDPNMSLNIACDLIDDDEFPYLEMERIPERVGMIVVMSGLAGIGVRLTA